MPENKEVRKLELCDIAPYLPYGLKISLSRLSYPKSKIDTDLTTSTLDKIGSYIYDIKPYMRPLEQLTQEITHNGVTFIPIVELFNLQGEEYYIVDNMAGNKNILVDIDRGEYGVERHTVASFSTKHIHLYSYKQVMRLVSWHFDISDLISSGLAIPIHNTK